MILGDEIERELRISEFLGDCPKRYKEIDKSIKFTLKQWNIIEEVLHQENTALQDRCEICEDMIRDKYIGELSQIHLGQLQDRKKEIEKILAKLESEEL